MKLTIFLFSAVTLAAGASETALEIANHGTELFGEAKYAEAEALYRRALDAWPREAGSARGRAIVNGSLGALLSVMGRYGEAEPLLLEAEDQLEAMGPPAYPDAARLLDHLARLYREQGDLAKAESYALRAEPMMGEPEKATNRELLASIYLQQRRYRQAERLSLADAASTDGRTALTAYLILAVGAQAQGEYVKTGGYARRALELARQTLPENHPATATALIYLAQACRFEGQYVEAERDYREAIAIWEETLGPNHPELATGLLAFAGFLHERERDTAAEALTLRAIRILEQAFGKNAPQVLEARIELADVWRAEHRYTESGKLSRVTLSAMQTAFEPGDPRLLHALMNQARLLSETKHKAEADAILKQLAQASSKSQPLE
jgi:tetratricopeptide (TPR) repeat protein